jgi:hypothetical protein
MATEWAHIGQEPVSKVAMRQPYWSGLVRQPVVRAPAWRNSVSHDADRLVNLLEQCARGDEQAFA